MEDKKTPPLTPREFISAFRDLVGDTYLISVHNKNGRRSLNRWTANRPYVDEDSIRENWIEKPEKVESMKKGPIISEEKRDEVLQIWQLLS